jgi:hypothetical protein
MRSYAEQSSSAGHLVTDTLALGASVNGTVVFGCETRETGEIMRQAADGILGLGLGTVSALSQLASQGAVADVFSLCYGSWGPESGVTGEASANGAVVFGALPPGAAPAMQYTPLLTSGAHPSYYTVSLTRIELGGQDVASFAASSAGGAAAVAASYGSGYGTVLDSGTTFIYLPTVAFNAFLATVAATLPADAPRVAGPDAAFADVCYELPDASASSLSGRFPDMTLVFQGATLTLPPDNYLFAWGEGRPGAFCIGVFDNGASGALLGALVVRDVLVLYDRTNMRIGLARTSCTALMTDGLGALTPGSPPPAPPAPDVVAPPPLAPGMEAPTAPPSAPDAPPSPPPPPPPPRPPPVPVADDGRPPLVLALELHGAQLQLYDSSRAASAELRAFLAAGLGIFLEQVNVTDLASCVPGHACPVTAWVFGLSPPGAQPGEVDSPTPDEVIDLLERKEVHLATPLGRLILVRVVSDATLAAAPPAPPAPGAPPGFVAMLVIGILLTVGSAFAAMSRHLRAKAALENSGGAGGGGGGGNGAARGANPYVRLDTPGGEGEGGGGGGGRGSGVKGGGSGDKAAEGMEMGEVVGSSSSPGGAASRSRD